MILKVGRMMADFFILFYITVLDAIPYQRLGLHPRTLMCSIPYYLRP
jgi:hypothetical protein